MLASLRCRRLGSPAHLALAVMLAAPAPHGRVVPPDVAVVRNVAYGTDPKQRFDVYVPRGARNAAVVLMVHGGAWRIGDKRSRGVVENKVAHWSRGGIVVISVNYRMLPGTDPVEQARDVARALAAAQRRMSEWGGDAGSVVLMGHSAGAHLVALLDANPTLATSLGARTWLGAVIDAADRFAVRATSLGVRAEVLPVAKSHAAIDAELGAPGAYTEAVDTFLRSLGIQTS